MLAKVMLGMLGMAIFAGAYVVHEGAIRVSVDEHKPGQKAEHVRLIVPAAIVPMGMKLVSDERLRHHLEKARPWLPTIRVASQELARLPDTELVEVKDRKEHVRISTRGGKLMIDVDSDDENVHVSFPLRMVESLARDLEARQPAS